MSIDVTYSFSPLTRILSAEVNTNYTDLRDAIRAAHHSDGDGTTLVNADIAAGAAIAFSKLAALTAGYLIVGNGSNVPTAMAITGDVLISSGGVTSINTGVIVNADVDAAAAIAWSKISKTGSILNDIGDCVLTSAASGDIIYRNGSNQWVRLAKGSDGEMLTLASGLPSWSAVAIDHNDTGSKQGGTAGEYYHLTSAEHAALRGGAASDADAYHTHASNVIKKIYHEEVSATATTHTITSGFRPRAVYAISTSGYTYGHAYISEDGLTINERFVRVDGTRSSVAALGLDAGAANNITISNVTATGFQLNKAGANRYDMHLIVVGH